MIQTYRLEQADTNTQKHDRQATGHPFEMNSVMKPGSLEIGGVQEHHEVTG
jgi:hypothetical protein